MEAGVGRVDGAASGEERGRESRGAGEHDRTEARIMQHGDGAMAASYNAQIATEASHKIIVGAHLSQCSSDVAVGLPDLQYSTVGAAGMVPSSASVISSSRALASGAASRKRPEMPKE